MQATCKTCRYRSYCPEQSRGYACRAYKKGLRGGNRKESRKQNLITLIIRDMEGECKNVYEN